MNSFDHRPSSSSATDRSSAKTDLKQSSKTSSVKTDSSSVASVAVQPAEEPTPALVPVLLQPSDDPSAQRESSATPVPAQRSEESSEPSETPSAKPKTSVSKTCVQDESSVSEPVSVPASTQASSDVPQKSICSEDGPRSLNNEPDLWLRAYTVLQEQQPQLMKAYNTHLASLQHDQEHGSGVPNERSVKLVVNQLLDDREKKKYRVPLLKKDVKIRDQVEKVARFALWFDPVVKNAVSTQPYAALAWSGASLLLPVSKMIYAAWYCPR